MSTPTTPNLNLYLPNFNDSPWHDEVNDNFRSIDATIKSIFGIQGLLGEYKNSTAVTSGQRYFDSVAGFYYEAQSDFTTLAAPNTFAQERTAHPTRWELLDAAAAINAAQNAANSAAAALTSKNEAATSATNAATSETNAAASATAAAGSATTANTKAGEASTSASNAAGSATTATTKAGEASSSATAAATSETNAANSASAASTSETNATTKAGEASTSANNALSSQNAAAGSATSASTSAGTATTKANEASASATAAATSETNAGTSETNAAASATAAANSASSIDVSGFMRKDQNLSDVANLTTAKTNLGINNTQLITQRYRFTHGSVATTSSTETAAVSKILNVPDATESAEVDWIWNQQIQSLNYPHSLGYFNFKYWNGSAWVALTGSGYTRATYGVSHSMDAESSIRKLLLTPAMQYNDGANLRWQIAMFFYIYSGYSGQTYSVFNHTIDVKHLRSI